MRNKDRPISFQPLVESIKIRCYLIGVKHYGDRTFPKSVGARRHQRGKNLEIMNYVFMYG